MNTLLPGYNRPVSEARIVDKELLQAAQQLARKHEGWALANAVLREAYGEVIVDNSFEFHLTLYRNMLDTYKIMNQPRSEYVSYFKLCHRVHAVEGDLCALRALKRVYIEKGYEDIANEL
ncbi:hypothetical protein [Staphylococcus aureus]|uniref:hypothetical protein n=1 Tax=Staphylococcus aureus TaxID=1280 RepID=UPI002E18B31B|nr:hypothetical protein [Staphylococcus aureus]